MTSNEKTPENLTEEKKTPENLTEEKKTPENPTKNENTDSEATETETETETETSEPESSSPLKAEEKPRKQSDQQKPEPSAKLPTVGPPLLSTGEVPDKKGGPEGKPPSPLPPPPLIGQDGKEFPRPVDREGKPLPIYISEKGLPVLDSNGRPIPLRFDENGKPIPLEFITNSSSNDDQETKKVPRWICCVALLDMVLSMGVSGVASYFYYSDDDIRTNTTTNIQELHILYISSLSICGVGIFLSILPMIAVSKNKFALVSIWMVSGLLLLIGNIVHVCYSTRDLWRQTRDSSDWRTSYIPVIVVPASYSLFRVILQCIATMAGQDGKNKKNSMDPQSQPPSSLYPRTRVAPASTVVQSQQPRTVVQHVPYPVPVPAYGGYGYGYPYGGYGGYGYGINATDAILLGGLLGGYPHYPYYGFGGYDMGFW